MIIDNRRYIHVRKDLLLVLAALLLGVIMFYNSLLVLATPVSYSFEVQSGLVSNSSPTVMQASKELEQEHQQLVDLQNQLQNR